MSVMKITMGLADFESPTPCAYASGLLTVV